MSDEEYKRKADENVLTALDGSVFSMKEKRKHYWREWMKKYAWLIALYIACALTLCVLYFVFKDIRYSAFEFVICFGGMAFINERRTIYVEKKVYEDKLSQLRSRYGETASDKNNDEEMA